MPAPPPRITALLDKHWTAIHKAVNDGLLKDEALDKVFPTVSVTERKGAPVIHTLPVLFEQLDTDELDAQCFTTFGVEARYEMWRAVLDQLAPSGGSSLQVYDDNLAFDDLHGTGLASVVALTAHQAITKILQDDKGLVGAAVHLYAKRSPAPFDPPGCAIAFRPIDGPYIRVNDFTLGWSPEVGGATLYLTGRFEVCNGGPEGSVPRVIVLRSP